MSQMTLKPDDIRQAGEILASALEAEQDPSAAPVPFTITFIPRDGNRYIETGWMSSDERERLVKDFADGKPFGEYIYATDGEEARRLALRFADVLFIG